MLRWRLLKHMKHLAVLLLAVAGLMTGTTFLHAQTFNSLYSLSALEGGAPETNSDGQAPYGTLLLSGGTLYGTAYLAGTNGSGTVFAISTNGGGYTVLHSFGALVNQINADGAHPYNGLALAGGMLYGTTFKGGANSNGTVFAVSTNGTNFSVLYTFTNGLDGGQPYAGLVYSGGTLYGTTSSGGSNGVGTIFSVSTNGSVFNVLHSFNTNVEGGLTRAGLALLGNVLYGTTYSGGTNGYGAVYSINTTGSGFAVLHSFAFNSEGGKSESTLTISGNSFFGTTSYGGTNGWGTVFSLNGTSLSVLHTFTGGVDGGVPAGSLLALGNTLYGTTQDSDPGFGTIFSLRTNGAGLIVLHTFGGVDGSAPSGGLVLSGKTAFGTTTFGGANMNNGGTVFSLSIPILRIASVTWSGGNLVINGEDGLSNGVYSVLMSPNLASPIEQWTSMGTSELSSNGNFSVTVKPSGSPQYYILQMQ